MKHKLYVQALQSLGCINIQYKPYYYKFNFDPIELWTVVVTKNNSRIAKAHKLEFNYAYVENNEFKLTVQDKFDIRNFDEIYSSKEEAEKEALKINTSFIHDVKTRIVSCQREIDSYLEEISSKKKWLADLEEEVK